MACTDTSRNPKLQPRHLRKRRLTPGKPWSTGKIPKSTYITQLGGPSVMIPISVSSEISSITGGNPSIAPITSNRPSDVLRPTIPTHKLVTTSTKADARFPSTFATHLNGRCTIKSSWWIINGQNGGKPPSPHKQLAVCPFLRPCRMRAVPCLQMPIYRAHDLCTNPDRWCGGWSSIFPDAFGSLAVQDAE